MLKIIAWLVVLLIATLTFVWSAESAPKPKGPSIVFETPSRDRCDEQDALGPCPGRKFVVHNPLKKPVVVVMSCKIEPLLTTCAVIPAKSTYEFDLGIGTPLGIPEGNCFIERWEVQK